MLYYTCTKSEQCLFIHWIWCVVTEEGSWIIDEWTYHLTMIEITRSAVTEHLHCNSLLSGEEKKILSKLYFYFRVKGLWRTKTSESFG